ncbi:MAG: hypothetical protein LBL13_01260, partial [Bacteroidales bacterium]|nr:hypothetical protein [Bacteroidales bacterium]
YIATGCQKPTTGSMCWPPACGITPSPERSPGAELSLDFYITTCLIYHMATSIYILDAQNSWHDDHNYRDTTGRQQQKN